MTPADAPLISGAQVKITQLHIQRWACIYIRQSTMKQVAQNRESQLNQYHLVQRAESYDLAFIVRAGPGFPGREDGHIEGGLGDIDPDVKIHGTHTHLLFARSCGMRALVAPATVRAKRMAGAATLLNHGLEDQDGYGLPHPVGALLCVNTWYYTR